MMEECGEAVAKPAGARMFFGLRTDGGGLFPVGVAGVVAACGMLFAAVGGQHVEPRQQGQR